MDQKTIIAAAMEDDCLVFAAAKVRWSEAESFYKITQLNLEKSDRPIENINWENPIEDDQGDYDNEELFGRIRAYAGKHDTVDAIAISLYGTVNPADQTVVNFPNQGKKQGQRLSYNLPELIRLDKKFQDTLVLVDNDASAAAMGEFIMGVGGGSKAFAYVWAGIGVNVGLIFDGALWEGRMHPEIGHYLPRRHEKDSYITGSCITHKDCLMGLCSYRSIRERRSLGMDENTLREVIGYYYAQLCRTISVTVAPDRIAMGGHLIRSDGIPSLVDEVSRQFHSMMGPYPSYTSDAEAMSFIRTAQMCEDVSVIGMIETARRELDRTKMERK